MLETTIGDLGPGFLVERRSVKGVAHTLEHCRRQPVSLGGEQPAGHVAEPLKRDTLALGRLSERVPVAPSFQQLGLSSLQLMAGIK
jgi:hypothetical protein